MIELLSCKEFHKYNCKDILHKTVLEGWNFTTLDRFLIRFEKGLFNLINQSLDSFLNVPIDAHVHQNNRWQELVLRQESIEKLHLAEKSKM